MKVSCITTIYNEEKTIQSFLESLFTQSRLPDELIIVDGGSTDGTVESISQIVSKTKIHNVKVKIIVKKGNRSVGRNEAIKHASGNIIACSDSGNILDKNWLQQIVLPFTDPSIAVVAGYYKGKAKTQLQKCLLPYVLVMPDKVDPQSFLPATRSIAFRKSIWKKVGGFDEEYSHNEDYVFAKKLQKAHAKIIFQKDAIVYWIPRETFAQAFVMFFRFAYGDAEAKIYRPKVIVLFIRYMLLISLLSVCIIITSFPLLVLIVCMCIFYSLWSIQKNYRYVKSWHALYLLPLLQVCADIAVLAGTFGGTSKNLFKS